ncbi:MAG TPA: hypothetical protein VFZ35_04915, partial [Sphingomicrobium sp.]
HFVFHSGFCCSTLLTACFDQPGLASTLSEPMILNDIVGWRQRGAAPAAVGTTLNDALAMLARPFEAGEAAIVKPSTVVNGLASAILRLRPDARAILVHAPLQDFLISIAKKGIDGRLWARELFLKMRREGLTQGLGFDDEAFFGQTDLQIAACAWLGQQAIFASIVDAYPDRVRTIDSVQFLDQPDRTIQSAADLFGLEMLASQIGAALAGPMRRNSKDQSGYSREKREADYASALEIHGDEIRKVAIWAAAVAEPAGIRLQLPAPLL